MKFPKWLYHAVKEAKIANSEADEASLRAEGFGSHAEIFDKPLHVCKPGETYREHQEGFAAKDEGKVEAAAEVPPAEAPVAAEAGAGSPPPSVDAAPKKKGGKKGKPA